MEEPRKPRLRFSLLNLLALTTIIAMGLVIGLLYSEVVPLRAENRRLRDEVGELSIGDPTKLYAIRVPDQGKWVWKWRVWLPPGRTYGLLTKSGEIHAEGFPKENGAIFPNGTSDKGEEIWVKYEIVRDEKSGKWVGSMSSRTASVGSYQHDWVDSSAMRTNHGVGSTTSVAEPDEKLVLARVRAADVDNSNDMPDPADGFMVWIEPQ